MVVVRRRQNQNYFASVLSEKNLMADKNIIILSLSFWKAPCLLYSVKRFWFAQERDGKPKVTESPASLYREAGAKIATRMKWLPSRAN